MGWFATRAAARIAPVLLSFSPRRVRWAVTLAGRRHVVEVAWAGFDNHIAVDGVVIDRWSWPGNNLRAKRSFQLGAVPCTVIRRRSDVLQYAFELRVDAPGALTDRLEVAGSHGAEASERARGRLVLALLLGLLLTFVVVGIALGWAVRP